VKFHRAVIIISTEGITSAVQREIILTRGLETAWRERGGVLSFTRLLIAGFTFLGVDD